MSELCNRRQRIYGFIVQYKIDHNGNSPTIREIGDGVGVRTTSIIYFHLKQLEFEGRLRLPKWGQSRSIEVIGSRWVPPGGVDLEEKEA